jgi:hypothetical protein
MLGYYKPEMNFYLLCYMSDKVGSLIKKISEHQFFPLCTLLEHFYLLLISLNRIVI